MPPSSNRSPEAIDAPLMANMTEFGQSPLLSLDDLADLGYAAVLYPVTLLRVAMKAVEAALGVIGAEGTQAELARPDADAPGTLRPDRIQRLRSPRSQLFFRRSARVNALRVALPDKPVVAHGTSMALPDGTAVAHGRKDGCRISTVR